MLIGEWSTIDKSEWKRGPWHNEPDKIHWIDEATGMDCLMHRNSGGAWCGYVAVTEGHPDFQRDYGDVPVDVHGNLTYSDFCQKAPDGAEHAERGICHVPQPGRPERVWWLGFDCAHGFDVSPKYEHEFRSGTYKHRAYVEGHVRHLAAQLAARAAS